MTPGDTLRTLRKEREISIEDLSFEVDITPLALGNIERGTAMPQRKNLIRVLDFLEQKKPIPNWVRVNILRSYGYADTFREPTKDEVERAINTWSSVFSHAPFLSYLVDYKQDIIACNELVSRFVGISADLIGKISILDLLFSTKELPVGNQIVNLDFIKLDTVFQILAYFRQFGGEEWCENRLEEIILKYPEFRDLYEEVSKREEDFSGMYGLETVEATVGDNLLKFRMVGNDIAGDIRFTIVQYIPADAETAVFLQEMLVQARNGGHD